MKIFFLATTLAITIFCEAQIKIDSLQIENNWRTFHFIEPQVKSKKFCLLFIIHGSGGSGEQMMNRVKTFEGKSDQEKVIVVFPSGYKNFWNECRKQAKSQANVENINEEDFFKGMIAYFHKKYKIEKDNVFAIGTSGGGHMAFKLGLTMPSYFKGLTALIANLPDTNNLDCPELKQAVNMMIVNGTEDKTNPYNGGEVILSGGSFGHVRSTERTFAYWSNLAGYTGTPIHSNLPNTNPKDGKTIEEFRYAGREKEVVLLKVNGGKHDYPGDIDVHAYAWEFFKSLIKK